MLDLGPVPAADRAALPAFVRDLRAALPPSSRILVVVPPITDRASQRRAAGYDLRDLSRPAMLVLRAWAPKPSSDGPRPIASLAWYKQTLRYTLAHAPRSRVIVALPTWGAVWSASGVAAAHAGRAVPPREAEGAAAAVRRPHRARTGQAAYVESDRSLQLKLEVARAAHVAGVALWVRGGESAGVWREPLIARGYGAEDLGRRAAVRARRPYVVPALETAPRRGRHATAATDVEREVVGLRPAQLVDAEPPERDHDRRQRVAPLGEPVLGPQRPLGVDLARDDALLLHPPQPAGQQVRRDLAQGALQVGVARDAAQEVADDQQRPPVAEGVEGGGDGAIGRIGGHGESLSPIVTRHFIAT